MPHRQTVFGLNFSTLSQSELISAIANEPILKGSGARSIHTANLDHIVNLRHNQRLRAAYNKAWAVTADGAPVFVYARLCGASLPARVTGADLFAKVLGALSLERSRCFFVAASEETARLLLAWSAARGFDPDSVSFEVPPFGFEKDAAYSTDLARRIAAHGTTHLFLGVGAPKSEIWINEHRELLGDCYALNVGAALDFFVGIKRRAPRAFQRFGLEWLWRFSCEPRRLFRRYFVDSWTFFAAVYDDILDWSGVRALAGMDGNFAGPKAAIQPLVSKRNSHP